MSPRLRIGGRSDVGMQRQDNQDSMYAGPRLAAVADGVGGAAGGEVASRLTITALMPLDTEPISDPQGALQAAADNADASIRETVASHGALAGMGTTLTALLATDDQVALAHIGDSRAYRLRDGTLSQLTRDHTLVQSLIDEGQISEEEALTHPRRSWIMRALDGRGHPDVDITILDVQPGDRYLLCTDGLSSYVSETDIKAALQGDDPQQSADRLVDLALHAGGPDNVTCIVADPADTDADSAQPILGGAVAEADAAESLNTSAEPAASEAGDHAAPRHSWSLGRRLAAVAAVVVILVAAGVVAVAIYIHHQWYIAPSQGKVAVFQGVQGNAAGIDLSHLHALTNIPVTALPQDDRDRVANGIQTSGGQSGAATVVTNLRHEACALASSTPTPKPSPSLTPRPKPSGSKASARPTPPPPPAWCVNAP